MTIGRFEGGNPSARDKLNQLVEEVNALATLRGDERYIVVRKGPGGSTVSLNVAAVLAQVPRTKRSAGGEAKYCKISAKAGTEVPYHYSATQVEHDGGGDFSASHWTAVAGGDVMDWNLINLAECNGAAAGLAGLEVDDIVLYWPRPGGYACEVNTHRGTY